MMEEYKSIRNLLLEKKEQLRTIDERREQAALEAMRQTAEKIEQIKAECDKVKARIAKVNAYLALAESKKCAHMEPQQGREFNNAVMAQLAVQLNSAAGAECASKLYTEARAQKIVLEQAAAEYESKIRRLSEQSGDAPLANEDFTEESDAVRRSIDAFLHSEEFVSFRRRVFETTCIFTGRKRLEKFRRELALGSIPVNLFTAGVGEEVFDDWYKVDFSYGRDKAYPLSFDMTRGRVFLIEFEPINEMCVIAGLQNVLYNFLLHREQKVKQIMMIDPVRNNDTALGALSRICGMPGSPVLNVPKDPAQIRQAVESLLETVKEEKYRESGASDDVADRLVVFHDFPVGYDSEQVRWIQELCVSAAHYNMVVFVTFNKTAEANKTIREAVNMIQGYASCIYSNGNHFYVTDFTKDDTEFVWYGAPPALTDQEIEVFSKKEEKQELNNRYEERMNINEAPQYLKGRRKLDRIPYGLDEKGGLQSLDFEDTNFACYICGASRSGKSTFLHTLIASILAAAHPDDVEIWLVDFKKTEFSRYIDNLPPHIRYVVLDESPELVYDIIDRMTEILRKRQNQFMGKWEKLSDVPAGQYMPEIFVIIDEFSKMSQVLTDTVFGAAGDYTLKLQNLLTAGAAFGFKFIFSSQDFSEGTRGLTPTAKKQIQQRIAMACKVPDEIKGTLGLLHASDRDNWMMENLPIHYTLMRIPEDSEGNHLKLTKPLYFKEKEIELEFIDKVKQAVHPVKKYSPDDTEGYIYKQPLIIDGNSYMAFSEKRAQLQEAVVSGQEEGETLIALGEPRRLVSVYLTSVLDSYGENLLMITPINESECGASVVYTAVASLKMQGRRPHLWGFKRSGVYKSVLAAGNPFGRHVSTLEGICREIRELREKIEKKVNGNDFYFLLGIDSYIADMAFLPPKSVEAGAISGAGQKIQKGTAAERGVLYEALGEGEPDLTTRLRLALAGMTSGPVSPQESKETAPENAQEESERNRTEGPEVLEYDAREDLKFILTQGPRYGYHFFVLFTTWQEIKQSKLKLEDFKHRIVFRLSKAEASELMTPANAKMAEALDEHAFRYANGIEALSFRPYTHEGLSWSGMGMAEEKEESYLE